MIGHHGKTTGIAVTALLLALWQPPVSRGAAGDSPADKAYELWKEGAGLHLEENYEAAIKRFEEALDLHATARTYTYLGWSLSRLDRYEEAIEQVRRAIELDPEYPNSYNDLGAYLIELGRPEEAIPWLHQAIAMPDYCCPHYSYYQIGRALLFQGRVEPAKEALHAAIKIYPRYRAAWDLLDRIRNEGLQGL